MQGGDDVAVESENFELGGFGAGDKVSCFGGCVGCRYELDDGFSVVEAFEDEVRVLVEGILAVVGWGEEAELA